MPEPVPEPKAGVEDEPAAEPRADAREPAAGSREQLAAEAEPRLESAKTVGELLDQWAEEYETTDDHDRKRELAYRLVQMNLALGLSRLHPDEVKIRENATGALGFYVPGTREVAITPQGLELPAWHYRDVLVHEAVHAGKITGHRVLDEGLAQEQTRRRVQGAMRGIYEHEQRQAEKAFEGRHLVEALEQYDFEKPEELVTYYLETEWADRWRETLRGKLANAARAETERARGRLFEDKLAEEADKIERLFEQGAPTLHNRLKELGFDFKQEQREIFEELYVHDLLEQRDAA